MSLAPHPTSIVASGAITLNNDQAGSPTDGFFLNRPAGLINSLSDADAILSSILTPALEGGRSYSHSHLPELIGDPSFVSAWDLYLEDLRRALTVIGSSEDRGIDPEPCACVCVCVCANPVEDEPQTVPSMIVPREGSQ